MATVDRELENNPLSEKLFREAEELLELAEKLDVRCQEQEEQIHARKLIGVGVGLLLAFLFVSIWTPDLSQWWWSRLALTVFLVVGCAFLVANFRGELHLRREDLDRNQRAVDEIVSMLRETEQAVADRNHITALERAGFRIRLSRFGIGTSASKS